MPRRRVFGALALDELLLAASLFRDACVKARTEAPIASSAYVAAGQGLEATDTIAEALTGDRTLFWPKPHAAGMQR